MLLVPGPDSERATTFHKWVDPPGNFLVPSIWVILCFVFFYSKTLNWFNVNEISSTWKANKHLIGYFPQNHSWDWFSFQKPSMCLKIMPAQGPVGLKYNGAPQSSLNVLESPRRWILLWCLLFQICSHHCILCCSLFPWALSPIKAEKHCKWNYPKKPKVSMRHWYLYSASLSDV